MLRKSNKDPFTTPEMLEMISWKSPLFLRQFTTRFGNIKPRKYSGLSVSHQKKVRQAIIRARELGLMHYTK